MALRVGAVFLTNLHRYMDNDLGGAADHLSRGDDLPVATNRGNEYQSGHRLERYGSSPAAFFGGKRFNCYGRKDHVEALK
jgi:hypothetical protein